LTNAIVALTRIESKQGRPPVCEISWGTAPVNSDFPFSGVVTNLTQRFTLFRNTGEPVRANLTVVLSEFLDPEQDQRQTDPELTTRVVRRGDTVTSIAASVYGDPSLWRVIAEANNLDDPRRPKIGRTLTIPKIG
jgi:nucleoid-associated protein YgaU